MTEPTALRTLRIYRRAGCHLCDDAEILLRDELAIRARTGYPAVQIERVDIAADPGLEARYRRRIPVFAVGADESGLVISAGAIREFLDRTLPTA